MWADTPTSTPLDFSLEELAEAVAQAAYRMDDEATDGFDAEDVTSATAAEVVDGALQAVMQRQRNSHRATPEVALDTEVLDSQMLRDLAEFLRHTRQGMLTRQEVVQEARMWLDLLAIGWPSDARDAPTVAQALHLLAALPDSELAPIVLTPVEPANELERVMATVAVDESARSALWQALWDGELVLPVVAYELIRPEGAHFQFLAAPYDQSPLVFGFATEDRFDALLPDDAQVSRVTPLGRDLPKFWPEGHWLMINPGYENQVVLSPWEIAGLPDSPRTELPHPRAALVEPVADDDPRRALMAEALAALPDIRYVTWAQVRPVRQPKAVPQDVVVVTTTDDAAEATAIRALSRSLPLDDFPKTVVLARQTHLAHPFVESILTKGRQVEA